MMSRSSKKYAVSEDSPSKAIVPGDPIPLDAEEYFQEMRIMNQDSELRDLVEKAITKTKLYLRHFNMHGGSGDFMVDSCVGVARKLTQSMGIDGIRVHQVMAVILGLLAEQSGQRLLLEIATGEGKTLICRYLAACIKKFKNLKVDLVSSAKNLAEREVEESKSHYEAMNMRVASGIEFYGSEKTMEVLSKDNIFIKADVIIGTVHDLSVNQLNEQVDSSKRYQPDPKESQTYAGIPFTKCRPDAYLIVDEVDSMFIDEMRSSTRITSERKELNKFDYLSLLINTKMHEMYSEVPPDQEVAIKEVINFVEGTEFFKLLSLNKLERSFWEVSKKRYAGSAYSAKYLMRNKRDYIIENGKIEIVDKDNTGEIRKQSRWNNFLHEFLEMKHQIPVKRSTPSIATKSVIGFFDDYKNRVFGLTGTLGDDSTIGFLKAAYNVKTLRMPKSHRNKMIIYKPIGVDMRQQDAKFKGVASQELLDFVCFNIKEGRPCLLINETINQAEEQSRIIPEMVELATGMTVHPIVFTHSNQEGLHSKVQNVKPTNIIFATNLASRGTDIKISTDCKRAGGLATICTYLPKSIRTQKQIEGRSARNGDNGSSILIISGVEGIQSKVFQAIDDLKLFGAPKQESLALSSRHGSLSSRIASPFSNQNEGLSQSLIQLFYPLISNVHTMIAEEFLGARNKAEKKKLERDAKKVEVLRKADRELKQIQDAVNSIKCPIQAKIFTSVMNRKLEIRELQADDDDYNRSTISQLIAGTKAEIVLPSNPSVPIDPFRIETQHLAGLTGACPSSRSEEAQMRQEISNMDREAEGIWPGEEKNIRMVQALLSTNLGESVRVKEAEEAALAAEVRERMAHQTITTLQLEGQLKTNMESIADHITKLNDPAIKESFQIVKEAIKTGADQPFVEASVEKAFHQIEMKCDDSEIKEALYFVRNFQKILAKAEVFSQKEFDEHQKEYMQVKLKLAEVSEHNSKVSKKEDRKYFKIGEKEIGLIGLSIRASKGWLGYIIGAICITAGAAVICFCPTLPPVALQIAANFISSGLDMIAKNYQDNKNGTYSTSDTVKHAFIHGIAAVASPLIQTYVNPKALQFLSNRFSPLANRLARGILSLSTTKTSMITLGVLTLDKLGYGLENSTVETFFSNLHQNAKPIIEAAKKETNLALQNYYNHVENCKKFGVPQLSTKRLLDAVGIDSKRLTYFSLNEAAFAHYKPILENLDILLRQSKQDSKLGIIDVMQKLLRTDSKNYSKYNSSKGFEKATAAIKKTLNVCKLEGSLLDVSQIKSNFDALQSEASPEYKKLETAMENKNSDLAAKVKKYSEGVEQKLKEMNERAQAVKDLEDEIETKGARLTQEVEAWKRKQQQFNELVETLNKLDIWDPLRLQKLSGEYVFEAKLLNEMTTAVNEKQSQLRNRIQVCTQAKSNLRETYEEWERRRLDCISLAKSSTADIELRAKELEKALKKDHPQIADLKSVYERFFEVFSDEFLEAVDQTRSHDPLNLDALLSRTLSDSQIMSILSKHPKCKDLVHKSLRKFLVDNNFISKMKTLVDNVTNICRNHMLQTFSNAQLDDLANFLADQTPSC